MAGEVVRAVQAGLLGGDGEEQHRALGAPAAGEARPRPPAGRRRPRRCRARRCRSRRRLPSRSPTPRWSRWARQHDVSRPCSRGSEPGSTATTFGLSTRAAPARPAQTSPDGQVEATCGLGRSRRVAKTSSRLCGAPANSSCRHPAAQGPRRCCRRQIAAGPRRPSRRRSASGRAGGRSPRASRRSARAGRSPGCRPRHGRAALLDQAPAVRVVGPRLGREARTARRPGRRRSCP